MDAGTSETRNVSTPPLDIKVDEALHNRLKNIADRNNRSLQWLTRQALVSYLEAIERGQEPPDQLPSPRADAPELPEGAKGEPSAPFVAFAQQVSPQTPRRAAITAAWRRPEPECVTWLLAQAKDSPLTDPGFQARVHKLARRLSEGLRARPRAGGVEALIQEFALSSQEGVALMCLAEALLRIPDSQTRDALIRDKIGHGDWKAHVGQSPSIFVNAATWGLVITGRLVGTSSENKLASALTRVLKQGGEPLVRKSVDLGMRMMGEQFVTGETIEEALANARKYEAKGFRYSYDMLGEAATTEADAQAYMASYEMAIHAIGKASGGRGIYEGPGISIKLSALHPRYSRAQVDRVQAELLPRVRQLALLCRQYDIPLNIDAEETDRLEISLDLLESLCFDPALAGWNGIGFVIQAYQKRCPYVIDYVIDLARRSHHRIMVRLVKGAYWDSEIKRAQLDGMDGYPVYTRKVHTDVSYQVCARKLLEVPDAIYPMFATHNAQTLATIYELAGRNYYPGQYEFQCLHGMGEPLYEQVTKPVSEGGLGRPCRVYAPVGTYETLLAYLVRRLLENGANTSFVNRVSDPSLPIDQLITNPIEEAASISPVGAPHDRIPLPVDLYATEVFGKRTNSSGIDLANEQQLATLSAGLLASTKQAWLAQPGNRPAPATGKGVKLPEDAKPVLNPADHQDVVGHVVEATPADIEAALKTAEAAAKTWKDVSPADRAACLQRAAQLMEDRMAILMGLVIREAGKSLPNAIAEIREAVDFLRYYANQVTAEFRNDTHQPLGPVLCISPWNFPLAIFTGQVSAALAAGRADAADCRRSRAHPARGRRPGRRAAAAAGRRRAGGRPAGGRSAHCGRHVHRLHRSGTPHCRHPGPAPGQRGSHHPADRRDRWPERDDRGLLRADRTGGAGRAGLGLRLGRPALLGPARAVRAGRQRRSRADHAGRRHPRAASGQPRRAGHRRGPRDRHRGTRQHRQAHRHDARQGPSRQPARQRTRRPSGHGRRHLRAAHAHRDPEHQGPGPRGLRSRAARAALQA